MTTTTGIGGLPAPDLTRLSTGQTTTQPANTVPGMNFNPATNSYNPIPSTVPATNSSFDNFKNTKEYQDYVKSQEGGMQTQDMYVSPYFGLQTSGSYGRGLDEAYKKWAGANLPATAAAAAVTAAATKGNSMDNLLQGDALPDVKTTTTNTTAAPDWYDKFLSGLDTSGKDAITKGGIAGASGLQAAAYNAAPTAINAGLPTLNKATDVATGAAGALDINQYMNPYMTGVVDEIGRLGARNYNEYLKPAATAATVGSGGFGSRRGMQVQGQVGRDVAADILGRQTGALQSGFDNAIKAAIQKQQNETLAANSLGTLSGQEYTQGVGGLDVLSKLGAQQQATSQAVLNYPMSAQKSFSDLLRGFTIPTTQTQKFEGPMPGAYSNSPLSQIAGLGLSTAGIFANKVDPKTGLEIKGTSVFDTLKNLAGYGNKPTKPDDPTNNTVNGITYNSDGAVVNSGITYNSDGSYTLSDGTTVNPNEYKDTNANISD